MGSIFSFVCLAIISALFFYALFVCVHNLVKYRVKK